jgi:hypothetical protein
MKQLYGPFLRKKESWEEIRHELGTRIEYIFAICHPYPQPESKVGT